MAAFPFPATWASCQPLFGVVPRQRHTTWRTAFYLAFLHCLLQQKPCPNNWTVRAITRAVIGQLLWQSYSWKVIPEIPTWTPTKLVPEVFLEIFLREKESELRGGNNESRETPTVLLSLLSELANYQRGILWLNYTVQGKFFISIFVGAARRLGGSVAPTDEPPNRQATKLYTFLVL